jgi:hypothetical protein
MMIEDELERRAAVRAIAGARLRSYRQARNRRGVRRCRLQENARYFVAPSFGAAPAKTQLRRIQDGALLALCAVTALSVLTLLGPGTLNAVESMARGLK